ncbi:hypothetical protein HJFPF1_13348 [Paramyrothecium foliicola]|nr:hypothetical protein HJFPF1_13348 [Paramyrothecium foliicola]
MPDNYSAQHGSVDADAPVTMPSIVAADLSNVVTANALSEIEGIGLDSVELKFVHESQPAQKEETGMLTDIWRGMLDDVFGQASKYPRLSGGAGISSVMELRMWFSKST